VDWIYVTQGEVQYGALTSTLISLRLKKIYIYILARRKAVGFSRRTSRSLVGVEGGNSA
jgi:hypothetical protein